MGKSIDAVTVSTADHMHAPIALKAMRMGKHCFCQKPLTHTVYEARLMAKVAGEMKVATQMGNQGTSFSPLRKGAAIIKSGVLGPVSEVHVWTNRPIWPQGGARPASKPVPIKVFNGVSFFQQFQFDLLIKTANRRDSCHQVFEKIIPESHA